MPPEIGGPEADALALLCRQGRPPSTQAGFDIAIRGPLGPLEVFDPIEGVASRLYRVGCAQDLMVGALVYALWREGRADVEAPIGDYLPELKREGKGAGDLIRLKDLLNHACGYFAPPKRATGWPDLAAFLRDSRPAFTPGLVVNYGGPEGHILPVLIERVLGEALHPAIEQRLLNPAGLPLRLRADEIDPDWSDVDMSVGELVQLIDHLRGEDGPWGQDFMQRLEADRLAAVRTPAAASSRLPVAYAWGAAQFENGLWGQSGFGGRYSIGLRFDPQADFTLAGLFQGTQPRRDLLLEQITAAYGYANTPLGRRAPLGALVDLAPADLAGLYRGGGGMSARMFVEDQHLHGMIFRHGQLEASLKGSVEPDGVICGDSRWPGARMEAFRLTGDGEVVLTLGLTAFRRESA